MALRLGLRLRALTPDWLVNAKRIGAIVDKAVSSKDSDALHRAKALTSQFIDQYEEEMSAVPEARRPAEHTAALNSARDGLKKLFVADRSRFTVDLVEMERVQLAPASAQKKPEKPPDRV